MAAVKFPKGSEEFEMFKDYWNMVQCLWNVEDSEEYWKQTVTVTDWFYEKYKTDYAKGLINALLDELERRPINGRASYITRKS